MFHIAGGAGRPRGHVLRVTPVGSVRRRAARSKDLDLLVRVPARLEARLDRVLADVRLGRRRAGDRVEALLHREGGPRRRALTALGRTPGGRARRYRVDLFAATGAEWPFALFHYTGDSAYNIRTRAHAKARGWRLNQYGLFVAGTDRRARGSAAVRSERDLAGALGVTYRPPHARESGPSARQERPAVRRPRARARRAAN